MLAWKEWRETAPVMAILVLIVCLMSQIREGSYWKPEVFDARFWILTVLFLTCMALFLGAGAIAGERENGTYDILLARPIGLSRTYLTKYGMGVLNISITLLLLASAYLLFGPTHDISLHDLARGLAIFLSVLVFLFTAAFCISGFAETSANAFLGALVAVPMVLFAAGLTPAFRYTWWWRNSLDDMWLEYMFFYGTISLAMLVIGGVLFSRRILLGFEGKHIAAVAIIPFLMFVKFNSTSLGFYVSALYLKDLELVQVARGSVREMLEVMSRADRPGVNNLRELLVNSSSASVDHDLIAELSNEDPSIRSSALEVLADRGYQEALPVVLPLLRDPYYKVRRTALRFAKTHEAAQAVPDIIALLHDPNSAVRYDAVAALGRLDPEAATEHLVAMLDDRNSGIRSAVASQLCRLDYTPAQPRIVEMMLEDPERYVRADVAYYLGQMRSAPACDALIAVLSESDTKLASNAIRSLGKLKCEAAVAPLVERMEKSLRGVEALNAAISRRAGLSKETDEYAVQQQRIERLHEQYFSSPSSRMIEQIQIVYALAGIGSEEAWSALRRFFADPDIYLTTKIEIALALAWHGDKTALAFMREQMAKGVSGRNYAERMARLGDYSCVPVLIQQMENAPIGRKHHYGEVLTGLSGKKYGWDVKRWRKWWEKNGDRLLQQTPDSANQAASGAS